MYLCGRVYEYFIVGLKFFLIHLYLFKYFFLRNTRPVFKQIHNWPNINLTGSSGDPGLLCQLPVGHMMTRKTRSNRSRNRTSAHSSGYCEICRIEYLKLDVHLESEKHLNFVKDGGNFLTLDGLINDGSNFETFLKANCVVDENEMKSKKPSRARTTSVFERVKTNSPLSPADAGDARHRNSLPNSCLSNFIEDDLSLFDENPMRELRSSARQSNLLVSF